MDERSMDYRLALAELQSLAAEEARPTPDPSATDDSRMEASLDSLAARLARRATHPLALQLWAQGSSDARWLAVRLADPEILGIDGLDVWLREITDDTVLEAFTRHLALESSEARKLMLRWAVDPDERVQRCGFQIVSHLAQDDPDLDDHLLEEKLRTIESHVATSKDKAKKALSKALVTIGQRNDRLAALAIDVARRLGPIEIEIESGRLRADPVKLLEDPELARRLLG